MVLELAPDPREVGLGDVRQDERRLGELLGEPQCVAAERGDAQPGVHDHRRAALGGGGHDRAHAGVAQIEALGARMQLDAPRAGREAALQFRRRILARVHAAEGHEPALGGGGRGDDRRVGFPIAGRVHQGEGDRTCAVRLKASSKASGER